MVLNFIKFCQPKKGVLPRLLALLSPITEGGSSLREKNDRLVLVLVLLLLLEFNAEGVNLSLNYPAKKGVLFRHIP